MTLSISLKQKIFCAFCRLERRVYTKKSIDWTNVLLAFVAASLMMFILWQGPDARMIIFFVLFLACAEVFIRIRWRMSLPCQHCGFDPLLYKIDREETVRRVKAHLDQLKASGTYLMKSQNPFAHLPVIENNENEKANQLLDRRV